MSGILRQSLAQLLGGEQADELLRSAVSTFAGNISIADVGNYTSTATVEAALQELYADSVSSVGFIPLHLERFRIIASNDISAKGAADGGTLSLDTAPKLIRVNAGTDKCENILWVASSSIEIATTFYYPPDLDATQPLTVALRALSGGQTDAPIIAVGFFEGIGDTNRGGNTGATSGSLATVSKAITPTAGHPNFAAVTLIPAAHTTDTLAIYSAYVIYKKKLTS